jgi:hypothetical protein
MKLIPIDKKIEIYFYSKANSWVDTANFFNISYSSVVRIANDNAYKIKPIVFYPSPKTEPPVCKHFGCGRHLSPQEQLYGDKCISHN